MAENQEISKVELAYEDGTVQTLMDLTGDTVTPSDLIVGATAHDCSGKKITGEAEKAYPPQTKELYIHDSGTYNVRADPEKTLASVKIYADFYGSTQTKSQYITKNGTYTIKPDPGKTLSSVTVFVQVRGWGPNSATSDNPNNVEEV